MFSPHPKRLKRQPESPTPAFGPLAGRIPGGRSDSPFIHGPKRFHTEDGPMFDPFKTRNFGCTQPHNAPFWAHLIGETYASAVHAQPRPRPHPGMLPDVDFSRSAACPVRYAHDAVAGLPDDSVEGMRPATPVARLAAVDSDNHAEAALAA
jgi:hypothetical protein